MNSTASNSDLISKQQLYQIFAVVLCTSLVIVGLYLYMLSNISTAPVLQHTYVKKDCQLPILDPWNASVSNYLRTEVKINCSCTPSLMLVDEEGILKFNITAMKASYHVETKNLACSYRRIERKANDRAIEYGMIFNITPPEFIPARFFRVTCRDQEKIIYDDLLMNIQWKDGFSNTNILEETDDKLSVFVFGIDSLSRSHFIRKLDNTYNFLTEKLNADDFRKYVKVGENSFPNLLPLLTGRSISEVREDEFQNTYLDDLPFLWKEAAMLKYTTMYAEDRAAYSTFNYGKVGFRYPPTDYYLRPFMLAVENFNPILVEKVDGPRYCLGNIEQYKLQLEFFKGFLTKYKNKQRFVFSWLNQLTHNDFNGIENADETFEDLLQWMKDEGHLKRAVLIILSDHGFRLGGFSTTPLGRLETSFPFLGVYIPQTLKQAYPTLNENMLTNTERLITAFDLHQTIQDILCGRYNGTKATNPQGWEQISLFSSIPNSRTCTDAGIHDQFCLCDSSLPVSKTLPVVEKVAKFIIETINNIIKTHDSSKLCESLNLFKVEDARVTKEFNNNQLTGEDRLIQTERHYFNGRYTLEVMTLPGYGVFEGKVEYSDTEMEIIGDITRLNRYGDQSVCIKGQNIEQYCYCKVL